MGFESTVREGVLQVRRPDTRWLSTGWSGGFERADVAYNVTVPDGWDRTDLDAYLRNRQRAAGFDATGPGLLTGVEMRHARGARSGSVVALATVGVSNPAVLPVSPTDRVDSEPAGSQPNPYGATMARSASSDEGPGQDSDERTDETGDVGTVNLVVGTTRRLDDGALANLVAVAAEAKTATLLSMTGFPGTTTDAVVVGCATAGTPERFSGSATPVGDATRACVRDAVRESFGSRYATRPVPRSLADAEHGVTTDRRTDVFSP